MILIDSQRIGRTILHEATVTLAVNIYQFLNASITYYTLHKMSEALRNFDKTHSFILRKSTRELL